MLVRIPKPFSPAGLLRGSSYHIGLALACIVLLASGMLGGDGVVSAGKASGAPDLLWPTMRGLNFQTGELTSELGAFINPRPVCRASWCRSKTP